jgi:hypothetical protein
MRVAVSIESTPKKTFATAVDWPGWSRSGKTEELALEALSAYAVRYAPIAEEAGLAFPVEADGITYEVVETTGGGGGTDFGVPSRVTAEDRRPTTADEAERLAGLVEAAWSTFERTAAGAPAELRKGPRGGGRDTAKMVGHVVESDHAYAREIGVRVRPPADDAAVASMRSAMLDMLRRPSNGSPLADRTWTARYAARRIAWHALDHAWEIEDRSDPPA